MEEQLQTPQEENGSAGFRPSISAQEDMTMKDSAAFGVAVGHDLQMSDSGVFSIAVGHDLHLTDGGALILRVGSNADISGGGAALMFGHDVTATKSSFGVVVANQADLAEDSEVKVLMDTRKALIFGAAFGGVFAVLFALLNRLLSRK